MITNVDWLANDKHLLEAYSPINPIEVVWQKINDAVAYDDAGSTPYSTKQVIENVYHLVFNTGIFAADFWEWNKRAAADKWVPHLYVLFAVTH